MSSLSVAAYLSAIVLAGERSARINGYYDDCVALNASQSGAEDRRQLIYVPPNGFDGSGENCDQKVPCVDECNAGMNATADAALTFALPLYGMLFATIFYLGREVKVAVQSLELSKRDPDEKRTRESLLKGDERGYTDKESDSAPKSAQESGFVCTSV